MDDVDVDSDTRALITALEQDCASFTEHLLWVDCEFEPCMVHVWGSYFAQEQNAWSAVTCGLGGEGAAVLGTVGTGSEDAILERTVFGLRLPVSTVASAAHVERIKRTSREVDAAIDAIAASR